MNEKSLENLNVSVSQGEDAINVFNELAQPTEDDVAIAEAIDEEIKNITGNSIADAPLLPAELLYAALRLMSNMKVTKCLAKEEKKGKEVKFDIIFRVDDPEVIHFMKTLPLEKRGQNMCSSNDVEYMAKGLTATVAYLSTVVNSLTDETQEETQKEETPLIIMP